VTGSQHLYGPKTLEQVAEHSREIAAALGASKHIPVKVVFKPVLTTPDAIRESVFGSQLFQELHRSHHLDAHLLARQNVDRGIDPAQETIPAFAHTIQPRDSLVND
jgi:hypothetical protein